MTAILYDEAFFDENEGGSYRSGRVVLGLALPIVKPDRVLDVGCGIGTWLQAARELGARDVLGIDGDYVSRARLRIDPACFVSADLADPTALREAIGGRRFDLTMCLETAEHLPSAVAASLVGQLADTSDLVLWSAAVPGQGGTHHVNERPLTYWASLWSEAGFDMVDVLRPGLQMARVDVWYAQNCVFWARRGTNRSLRLRFESFYRRRFGFVPPLGFVHPATTSRWLGRPPVEVSARLSAFADGLSTHLTNDIGIRPEQLLRVDFADDGNLHWVGLRPPDEADGPVPILLVMSPDNVNVTMGLYYPAWRATASQLAKARDRARAGGLVWDDLLGRAIEGWVEMSVPEMRFRLTVSLAEGPPEPTCAREAARDVGRLWLSYFGRG